MLIFVFFFKQKTAYEIAHGDWSSDVCSSDLNSFILRINHRIRKINEFAEKLREEAV